MSSSPSSPTDLGATAPIDTARLDDTREGAAMRLGRAALAVIAAATVTTWLQMGIVAIRRNLMGDFSWAFWLRDQLLLSSIGYLLLFGVLALAPMAVHLLWPRRYRWSAFVGTLAALAAFSSLLLFIRIAPAAWFVLAAGVGLQVHRSASRHPIGWRRQIARVAVLGNLACVIVVVATMLQRASQEADAMRALPAARPDAPNVLLLILDTVRAGSLSLHGSPWETTPALAARAARSGVVFDNAFSTAPWTLPSHASMFTGRYASETTADWKSPLDGADRTIGEAFRDHGYATGGFVANINIAGYRSGLARGFIHYEDGKLSLLEALYGTTLMQSHSVFRALRFWRMTEWAGGAIRALYPVELKSRQLASRHEDKSAEELSRDLLAWIPAAEERPFFAFVNFFDAHGPMPPPMRYQVMFDSSGTVYGRYGGAIRYIDDTIDELLNELDKRGALDRTIVIVTSDHGEQFGEHGLTEHGNSLYRPLLHVPLVILNAPGAVAGTRVRRAVSLRDLPATVLDLASVPHTLPGTSLRPLLAGHDSAFTGSPVVSELSRGLPDRSPARMMVDRKSLIDDSSHVIRSSSGELEAFAYPSDTAEAFNLASAPDARPLAASRLERVLQTLGISWRP